jgi:predicted acyl esterase
MDEKRVNTFENERENIHIATHYKMTENVMIPMRDGIKLAGDLYLPAEDGIIKSGSK